MNGLDLASFGGKPERLGADAEKRGRFGQIEPGLDAVRSRAIDRDLVVRPQRGHALARPTIAVASDKSVPVQNAGNQIIIGDEHELPDGGDDVGGGAVALASAPARQAQFGMNAAHPVNEENDLRGLGIDIGDHLVDHGADDALLEPRICGRSRPDGPQIVWPDAGRSG